MTSEKKWKPIVIEGSEWLDGHYVVSEYGEVERVHKQGNIPVSTYPISHSPNELDVSLRVWTNTINKTKRIMISNLVAMHFIEPPKGYKLRRNTAFIDPTIEDDLLRHHYTNLKVEFMKVKEKKVVNSTQTVLSLDKRPLPNLSELSKMLNKSGNRRGFNSRGFVEGLTVPYYEFRDNGIYSNRTMKLVTYNKNIVLTPIYLKYKDKITSDVNFEFKGLTDDEKDDIISMIPNKRWNPKKKW